jgi:hypothetical protein
MTCSIERGTSESIRATDAGVAENETAGSIGVMMEDSVLSQAWKESRRTDASANGRGSGDFFLAMKYFILNKFLVVNILHRKVTKKHPLNKIFNG